jgi:hypothetical protein
VHNACVLRCTETPVRTVHYSTYTACIVYGVNKQLSYSVAVYYACIPALLLSNEPGGTGDALLDCDLSSAFPLGPCDAPLNVVLLLLLLLLLLVLLLVLLLSSKLLLLVVLVSIGMYMSSSKQYLFAHSSSSKHSNM